MSATLCLFRYSHLDFASHIRYSFTVGVPQMMLLELENQANVEKSILESLSDGEKKKLTEMLGIKVFNLDAFRVLPVAPHQDDLIGLESFKIGDDGKTFWIYPKEIVEL